ncbi:hypothetical protein [Methylobacter sp.]|uniref:hypothetical protein n=1 Tax=Methylobacter sp. TaxID=2051955 RepID=UPI00120A5675|nr:hypothetical protein [Methylobacter sp.]TAK59494.1 MAG: hypothetical protein EPO18_20240 [Methylobacter sp.]
MKKRSAAEIQEDALAHAASHAVARLKGLPTDKEIVDWIVSKLQYDDHDWSEGHAASFQSVFVPKLRTGHGDSFGARRYRGRAALRAAMKRNP